MLAMMNIPPQETFLYTGKWSPQADDLFLSTAVRMQSTLHPDGLGVADEAIFEAGVKMGSELGCYLTLSEMKDRVGLYETRYRTFKRVTGTPGARWDTVDKIVVASDEVWAEMLKINPFVGAYYYHDEPEFPRLAVLFGLDDVKEEIETNVVVISDTKDAGIEVIVIDGSESVDEVTSAAVSHQGPVSRKLFDEDGDSLDRESTSIPPPFYYVRDFDGGLVRKVAFSLGRTLHGVVPNIKCSPGGSSCASCSPLGNAHKDKP